MKHSVIRFALLTIFFLSGGVSAQTFTSVLSGAQTLPPNSSSAVDLRPYFRTFNICHRFAARANA